MKTTLKKLALLLIIAITATKVYSTTVHPRCVLNPNLPGCSR